MQVETAIAETQVEAVAGVEQLAPALPVQLAALEVLEEVIQLLGRLYFIAAAVVVLALLVAVRLAMVTLVQVAVVLVALVHQVL
jgi:hypothetical protein